ncbi:hypothetical protein ES703_102295 [subsurface metagenome]
MVVAFYRRAVAYFNLKDKPCGVVILGAGCLPIQSPHILIGTVYYEGVGTGDQQAGDIIGLHSLPVIGVDKRLGQVACFPPRPKLGPANEGAIKR